MYSADWCSDCRIAKKYLDEHNIEYELVDISKDPATADYVRSVNGGKRIIPTFDIDGQIHTNPGINGLVKLITQ